jgi:hypothetical protein
VTYLLQRDCGGAVCSRQDIYLPNILLSWVRETWRGGRCSRSVGRVGVLRARLCHLRAGFQQCKSFVEMCTVRCCPLWHPSHCPMGTVPRVLVRRTASPAYADFGGLSSGAPPVVVRLDVVSFPPSSSAMTVAGCLLGGYPVGRDGVESALREGCLRTTTGVSQRWFSGHFRQVFFSGTSRSVACSDRSGLTTLTFTTSSLIPSSRRRMDTISP